jgi:tetratricopeptide (TPR) repeat protein
MRKLLIIAMTMLLANAAAADIPTCACRDSKTPEDTIAACTSDLRQKSAPENRAVTLTFRAKAYEEQGMAAEARADYDETVALAPSFGAWFNRGQFFLDSGKFAPATADFSSAIALYDSTKGRGIPDAQYWEAHMQRGHALRRGEHYPEAIEDYSLIIDQDSRNLSAYTQRAFCYSHLGKLDEDIADLNVSMKLNGIDAVSLYNRALAYVRKGDQAQAMADFNDAIKRSPNWAAPLVGRGNLLEQQGQRDKALADYHRAAQLEPMLPSAAAASARLSEP